MGLTLYILECSDASLYTGVTNDLERRFAEHQEGLNPDAYTYSKRPVRLLFAETFQDYNLAHEWEKRIKGWSKKKKWALIKGEWKSLKLFSECQNDSHHKNK
ncbi:MAG: GIY-YIG nuclease family protein [Schleiferiaceae bacterium]|nr:GIY-YIG nuclease family protein [Schleiferiaceae bacterium]